MRLNPADPDLLARLANRLGETAVVRPADGPGYLEEPRGRYPGRAAAILRPASTEETAFVVAEAAAARVAIVPWGGGTGLVGGQTAAFDPPPLVLALDRMRAVRSVSTDENAMILEAGVVLKTAQETAEAAGRLFPLSLASEGSATIGGVLSANAGGVAVLRYGNARDLCLGLEAVLPDGSVMRGLKTLRKDNTGYDLRHLLIGAEGTLGLITAAALRLFPRPAATATALVALRRPADAIRLLRRLEDAVGEAVSAFELMSAQGMAFVEQTIAGARSPFGAAHPWYALIDCAAADPGPGLEAMLAAAFEDDLALDAVLAASEAQRAALWRLREETPIANKAIGAIASHDISLPITRLARFIEEGAAAIATMDPSVRINCFGHVGDGNLHYNLFPPAGGHRADWLDRAPEFSRLIHDMVVEAGGSFSAEHGVGRLKTADLERYGDPAALQAMRAIKRALDPLGVMNPGAVLVRPDD